MVSAAIAGLLSAALTHFGATDGHDRATKQPPAIQADRAHPSTGHTSSSGAPVPNDDDRFGPANPDTRRAGQSVPVSRSLSGHAS